MQFCRDGGAVLRHGKDLLLRVHKHSAAYRVTLGGINNEPAIILPSKMTEHLVQCNIGAVRWGKPTEASR